MAGFLSPEAGQARRAWLDDKSGRVAEALRYYLGPSGVDRKMGDLLGLLNMTDAGDVVESADASRALWNDPSLKNAARYTTAAAASAIPLISAKLMNRGVDVMGDALASGSDDLRRFAADESGSTFPGELTPAQSKAQEVLDLLSAGRADEVTDDMMAAADDLYLFENYDLPMDEASRMARAEGMGFDTGTDLHHGTNADIHAFDSGKIGKNFGTPGDFSAGHYLTGIPDNASGYADFAARNYGGNSNVIPTFVRGERFPMDYEGTGGGALRDMMPDAAPEEMTERMTRLGVDGVEVWQPEKYTYGQVGPREVIRESITYNPANIRSRFARFDPRLKHLANLSAAAGGVAILPEEKRKRMKDYLEELK